MIPKLIAKFTNSLSVGISPSSAEMVLVSTVAKDGQTIPDGTYGFALDLKQDTEEYCIGEYVAGTVTFTKRGLSYLDGFTEVAGNKKNHKKGASVVMTSHPALTYIAKMLAGDLDLDGILKYPATRVINNQRQLVDKEYADEIVSSQITSLKVSADGALTVAVNSGYYSLNGVVTYYSGSAANALTDDAVNYVQMNDSALEINTSGFTAGAMPLAKFTTSAGAITVSEDARAILGWLDIKTDNGIGRDANGIFIDLATNSGLEFSSGKLKAKIDPNGGVELGANGLAVAASVRPITLQAYESLVAGDLLKVINDSGNYKLKKVVGIGSQMQATLARSYTPNINFAKVSADKIIIIHGKSSNAVYAQVGTISGTTITVGSEVTIASSLDFSAQIGQVYEVTVIDESTVVITYTKKAATSGIYAKVCSISGNVLTPGGEQTIYSIAAANGFGNLSVLQVSPSKLVFAAKYSSVSQANVLCATLSGGLFTVGSTSNLGTSYAKGLRLVKLDTDKVLAVYIQDQSYGYLNWDLFTLSGTAVTRITGDTFVSGASGNEVLSFAAVETGTNSLLLAFQKTANTTLNLATVTFTGSTPAMSSVTTVANALGANAGTDGLRALLHNNFLYLYEQSTAKLTKIAFNTSGVFAVLSSYTGGGTISAGQLMIDFGTELLLYTTTAGSSLYFKKALLDHSEFITSANSSYSLDQQVPIVSALTGFSSLYPGQDYYINETATGVTVLTTYQKVGKAINATTIIK